MQFSQILLAAQAANYGMNSESIGTSPSNQSFQVKMVIPIIQKNLYNFEHIARLEH